MLNILQGKRKSGKSRLISPLIRDCENVLFYGDESPDCRGYLTVIHSFNIENLKFDIEKSEKVVDNYPTLVDLIVINSNILLSPDDKEAIAEIAVETNTKIIILETINNYGN